MKVCMWAFGAFDYTVALVDAMSDICSVDLYCSRYHIKQRSISILEALKGKSRIVLYECYRNRDPRNTFKYSNLCRKVVDGKYDVLHFQEYGPFWMLPFFRVLKQLPCVMTVHDPYQHEGLTFVQKTYLDIMQRLFVKKADRIIVHGKVLKKQFLERYQWKTAEQITVLPHGNFSILKRWDRQQVNTRSSNRQKTILFFGTIRPNKGLEFLLKAEPLIRNEVSQYRIVIAGKCDDFDRYQSFIEPGAPIEIDTRYIPEEEVPNYFKSASLVVLPYISATQSGVIPLSYTFGKPVVATAVGAIPEIVEHEVTGILVPPRDEVALAGAIVRLLTNENLLRDMSRNALEYSINELSFTQIGRKTLSIYKQLVQNNLLNVVREAP